MFQKDEFTKRRFEELAEKSYKNNQYTFTSFLSEAELSEFCEMKNSIHESDYTVWGGREEADRVMIRFGNPDDFGYEEEFPVKCVKISPLQKKFADDLSHRDFLGAVMNLGIKRSETGDIIVEDKAAYIFCTDKMAEYICRELTRVRHTTVNCTIIDEIPETAKAKFEEGEIQAASERADGVISKIYRISRSSCAELFLSGKIFINGKCTENSSYFLKENDKVSVRGYGKFRYIGITGSTRKGNKIVRFEKYI